MTINDLMIMSSQYSYMIIIFFFAVPVAALITNFISEPISNKAPWKYAYSVLVYITSIPGIFCTVITLYTVLFLRQNILMLNAVSYFLPILSMIVTLAVIRKSITFDDIPGFNKLSGLITVIGLTFVSIIIIEKLRFFVISSIQGFVILCVCIFLFFKYGLKMIFGDFKKKGRTK